MGIKATIILLLLSLSSFGQRIPIPFGTGTPTGGGSHIIEWNVEIVQSQCGGATSDTFTVLVSLTSDSLKHTSLGGYVADWEGDDIRFYLTDTNTLLKWYKVRYRPDSGKMEMWVKTYATNVNFKMCVGSTTVTTFQGGSAADAWKSTVVAAYAMNDSTGSNLTDMSGHYTATQANSPVRVLGQAGFAESMTAASSQSYTAAITEIDGATKFSFLFWGKRATSGSHVLHGKRSSGSGGLGTTCYLYNDGWAYFQLNGGYGGVSAAGTSWIHAGMVFDGAGATSTDRCKIYINGANQILSIGGTIPTSIGTAVSDFIIGKDGAFSDRQSGYTDMLILYKTALSAAWVATAYNNQLNQSNLGNSGTPFLRFIRN